MIIMNVLLNDLNNNIEFICKKETNDTFTSLDSTMTRNIKNLEFNVYRKPTTFNTEIHSSFNHVIRHTFSAIEQCMLSCSYKATFKNILKRKYCNKEIIYNKDETIFNG